MQKILCALTADFVVIEDGVLSICFINLILHFGNCLIYLIGGSIYFKHLLNQTGNKLFSNPKPFLSCSKKEKIKLISSIILCFIWMIEFFTDLMLYKIFSIDTSFISFLNSICWLYCFRIMKEQYYSSRKNDSNIIKIWTTFHFIVLGFNLQSQIHFYETPILILISAFEIIFSFWVCILSLFFDSSEEIYSELDEEVQNKYETEKKEKKGFPFLFSFIVPLLTLGSKRPLEHEDLLDLPSSLSSEVNSSRLMKEWEKQLKRPKPNLFLALIYAFGKRILVIGIFEFIFIISLFISPVIINQIIQYVESDSSSNLFGFFLIFSLFLANIVQALSTNQYYWLERNSDTQIKISVMHIIYAKAFRLSNQSRQGTTIGEITNLISTDAKILESVVFCIQSTWSVTLQISIGLYLMYQELGSVCFNFFGVLVLLGPFMYLVSKMELKLQDEMMEHKDKRAKLMNEILNAIRIIKCFAWENSFKEKVSVIRNKELCVLRKSILYRALSTFFWVSTPVLISASIFTLYVLLGNELTVAKTFTCLTLAHLIEYPLYFILITISYLIQIRVSILRIQEFLLKPELERKKSSENDIKIKDAIQIQNGTFKWTNTPILKGINLCIPCGSLIAVVGSVGAGKSSLLSSILGEMEKVEGSVNINGSIAYVSQSAWIQNNTVQNNILFGEPFNGAFYNSVIKTCELEKDLSILPHGDKTQIGEKGINLSGGQKQRLSLARAVYQNKDIYLLDDPLSAVDSHVGKNLFHNCIKGILKQKTRILVTHQLQYVPYVDVIVVIKNGQITEIGSFQQLIEAKSKFYELYSNHVDEEVITDKDSHSSSTITKQLKLSRSSENVSSETVKDFKLEEQEEEDKFIADEDREFGSVSFEVWKSYLVAFGGINMLILVLIIGLFNSGILVSVDFWLSYWSSNPKEHDVYFYLCIYGTLSFISSVFIILYSIAFSLGGIKAAKFFHSKMLTSILRAPTKFFDINPVGRILNRFTNDQYSIDMEISDGLDYWIGGCIFRSLEILFVTVFVVPLLLLFLVPLCYFYQKVYQFYIHSSQELKRLYSISKSPIDTHLSETLHGISTIRAFQKQDEFLNENYHRIDENTRAWYCFEGAEVWFSLRLQFIGTILVYLSSFFIFLGRSNLAIGLVGLSLSYSLQLTSTLKELVRMYVDLQSDLVAVERISGFINVEQEATSVIESCRPPKNWPDKGEIVLENVKLRYREEMDLVLKGISCSIQSKEKIGVVGRTGAGKSSLFMTFFRLVELTEGKIVIDEIDISTIGLADLRSKISIIPQDPTLFLGTVRTNLDPFSEYSNEDIWRALENAHLKTKIKELPNQLETNVAEYGDNFSIGQRQLLCLARAILRNPKILIMDEATANVDMETDALIQQTIRKEFANCTVLTIAHRINTILDYDRVMVLDQGQIIELDLPSKLLENPSSLFSSLAKNSSTSITSF